jgi:hypothetical protein
MNPDSDGFIVAVLVAVVLLIIALVTGVLTAGGVAP